MTTSILISLAIPAAFIIAVFYFAGALIRRRMRTPDIPPHWLLDDSRELEAAFVDFFSSSKTSTGVLRVLAARRSPIGFKALTRDLQSDDEHGEIPLTAVRAVLKILLSAGLARMRVNGFSITDLGREVHRRMRNRDGEPATLPPTSAAMDDLMNQTVSGNIGPDPFATNGAK